MGFDIGLNKIGTIDFWKAIIAEFVGTTLFLLCVTCVALSWGNVGVSANNVEIAIGIGLSITSLAFAIGHVSGGHLNPAVSLGMIVTGKISIIQGFLYIIAQLVGSILGSALTFACTPYGSRDQLGTTFLNADVSVGQGFGLELLFTFLLVFFVFSITDENRSVEPYGTTLGIGVVIMVCHVCLIPFTGCGINPARSFGPAVVQNKWDDHWIYWIGPMVGGIVAALLYTLVFAAKPNPAYAPTSGSDAEETNENSV